MAMKMIGFSVTFDYRGKIRGEATFSGDGNYVSTQFNGPELEQIAALIESIKARVLDESAAQLIQARDDMLAIEHSTGKTDAAA
jgi:hypothetical protein